MAYNRLYNFDLWRRIRYSPGGQEEWSCCGRLSRILVWLVAHFPHVHNYNIFPKPLVMPFTPSMRNLQTPTDT